MEKVIGTIMVVEELIGTTQVMEEVVITIIEEVMGKTKLKTMTKSRYNAIIAMNTGIMLPNAKTHEEKGFKKLIKPKISTMSNQQYYQPCTMNMLKMKSC